MNICLYRPVTHLFAAAVASCALVPALAADQPLQSTSKTNARAIYAQERADCLSGDTSQGRATCLQEANAAFASRDRTDKSTLPDESPQALRENALRRCAVVSAANRYACEQMALGNGVESGSVEGGGILTKYVTIIPAQ